MSLSARTRKTFLVSLGLHAGAIAALFFVLAPTPFQTNLSTSPPFSVALEKSRSAPAVRPERKTGPNSNSALRPETITAPEGAPDAKVTGDFENLIRARIQAALRYPIALRRRGIAGATTLRIVLTGGGKIEELSIARSSGHAELDELALEAVRAAAPFVSSPSESPGIENTGRLVMSLPVDFRLVR